MKLQITFDATAALAISDIAKNAFDYPDEFLIAISDIDSFIDLQTDEFCETEIFNILLSEESFDEEFDQIAEYIHSPEMRETIAHYIPIFANAIRINRSIIPQK